MKFFHRFVTAPSSNQRGAALLELTIVFPFLTLITLNTIGYGARIEQQERALAALRQAARVSIQEGARANALPCGAMAGPITDCGLSPQVGTSSLECLALQQSRTVFENAGLKPDQWNFQSQVRVVSEGPVILRVLEVEAREVRAAASCPLCGLAMIAPQPINARTHFSAEGSCL